MFFLKSFSIFHIPNLWINPATITRSRRILVCCLEDHFHREQLFRVPVTFPNLIKNFTLDFHLCRFQFATLCWFLNHIIRFMSQINVLFHYSTGYHKIIVKTAAPCKNIFLLFQVIDFPKGFPLTQDRIPTPMKTKRTNWTKFWKTIKVPKKLRQ